MLKKRPGSTFFFNMAMYDEWIPTDMVRMHFVFAQCEKPVAEADASGMQFESLKLTADEFEACGGKPHVSDRQNVDIFLASSAEVRQMPSRQVSRVGEEPRDCRYPDGQDNSGQAGPELGRL